MEPYQGEAWITSLQEYIQNLGLQFDDLFLLSRALTHRSYLNEHPEALEDNERLEFLGDAVLDFIVGAWLYHHFPEKSEGDMTRMRSALVRTEQLAEFAVQINMATVMRLGKGEREAGGFQRPTLLCAMYEAFVGALYLDGGIEVVIEFIEPYLDEAIEEIISDVVLNDPKSRFQEVIQAQGYGPPFYRTVAARGPDHAKTFEVEVTVAGQVFGHGSGRSKQAAAKAAARAALHSLGES